MIKVWRLLVAIVTKLSAYAEAFASAHTFLIACKGMKNEKLAFAALGVAGAMIASSAMADGHGKSTLAQVKEKGFVQCGVSQGLPGFSNADDAGEWTGLDVDMCRAVAAAVFGDASAVKFTPLSAKQPPRWLRVKSTSCRVTPPGP